MRRLPAGCCPASPSRSGRPGRPGPGPRSPASVCAGGVVASPLVAVAALVLLALPAGMLVTAQAHQPCADRDATGDRLRAVAERLCDREPVTDAASQRRSESSGDPRTRGPHRRRDRGRRRPARQVEARGERRFEEAHPAVGGGQPDARRQRPRPRRRLRLVRGPGRQRPVRLGGGGQGWRGLDRAGGRQLHRRPGRVGALDRRPDRLLRLLWRHARERRGAHGRDARRWHRRPKACPACPYTGDDVHCTARPQWLFDGLTTSSS